MFIFLFHSRISPLVTYRHLYMPLLSTQLILSSQSIRDLIRLIISIEYFVLSSDSHMDLLPIIIRTFTLQAVYYLFFTPLDFFFLRNRLRS